MEVINGEVFFRALPSDAPKEEDAPAASS